MRPAFVATLILLSASVFCNLQPVVNHDIDAFINQLLAKINSPAGVCITVVKKDDQGSWNVETRGYGKATINGGNITGDTVFGIASNSKLFNALAVGLLIDNETLSPRLTWNTRIASVVPEFDLQDPIAAKYATILDAFSHRTGLPRHDFSSKTSDDTLSVIKKMKYHRPSAEFREVNQYTNNMYTLTSYLPTVLLPSKIPYSRYVKQHIFDPLELKSTTFSFDVAKATGRLADGIGRQFLNSNLSDFIVRKMPVWLSEHGGEDGTFLSGPGGIYSTPNDMAVWLQMLLLEGVNPRTNVSVIPAAAVAKAAAGVTIFSDSASYPELSPVVYGAGQLRGTYRGHEFIAHNGFVSGYASYIARLPWENIGIGIYSNDNDYGLLLSQLIIYRLMDEALGLPPIDWISRFLSVTSDPPPPSVPRPANASFPFGNIATLRGKYDNHGYGPFELCMAFPRDNAPSAFCKSLLAKLPEILPGALDSSSNVPTFFTQWDNHVVSHLKVTHFDGGIFNITMLKSVPTGNASEPFWTLNVYAGPLAYVDHKLKGIGFTGLWGAGDGIEEPQGKSVRERAEVWFERVSR